MGMMFFLSIFKMKKLRDKWESPQRVVVQVNDEGPNK